MRGTGRTGLKAGHYKGWRYGFISDWICRSLVDIYLQQEETIMCAGKRMLAVSENFGAVAQCGCGSVHEPAECVPFLRLKFIDHRGVVVNFPWGALARLGLARAYDLQGDVAKAKAAYQDFFAIWRDADADVPALLFAKTEYAKLNKLP
jgi:hypothetical protein